MRHYFLLLVCGLPALASAQTTPGGRNATVLEVAGATGPTLNYASVAGWRLWGLDRDGRFQVGLGVRGTYYFADYLELDRQREGQPELLGVMQPRLGAVNAAFQVRARVAGPVHVGFSLDLGGLSFGPERPGSYVGLVSPVPQAALLARPTSANLLLGGANDRGSLNSELYLSATLPAGLGLRVGYSHLVTGYEAASERFRRFRNLAAVGLSYQLP